MDGKVLFVCDQEMVPAMGKMPLLSHVSSEM